MTQPSSWKPNEYVTSCFSYLHTGSLDLCIWGGLKYHSAGPQTIAQNSTLDRYIIKSWTSLPLGMIHRHIKVILYQTELIIFSQTGSYPCREMAPPTIQPLKIKTWTHPESFLFSLLASKKSSYCKF